MPSVEPHFGKWSHRMGRRLWTNCASDPLKMPAPSHWGWHALAHRVHPLRLQRSHSAHRGKHEAL